MDKCEITSGSLERSHGACVFWNLTWTIPGTKFRQVVKNLRPLSVLDDLLEKGLIDIEEHKDLRSPWYRTDEDRSRMLLTEILPKKGPQSFQRFCEVLLAVRTRPSTYRNRHPRIRITSEQTQC